ncbi:MAG: hypothetical protein BEN18_01110 [Epulopiscium sp. Nuni2H_MBin001]|nr:MAG: hypothetical protein BEN18_01110 [Epulopiscium sp. Nuni2H_MBin001]
MVKKILALIILVSLCCVSVILGVGYSYYKDVLETKPLEQTFDEIRSHEDYVKIEEISPHFLNAIVAVEDRRFLDHWGFDVISLSRAFFTNLSAGEIVQGGSTITQQLAKNLFFSSNQTYLRKSAELFMALTIEYLYTKPEILEIYSNIIYLGKGYYGVEEAAQGYFNKSAKALTVEEAAYIAGLAQAPSIYSNNVELGLRRQNIVLEALDEVGYVLVP